MNAQPIDGSTLRVRVARLEEDLAELRATSHRVDALTEAVAELLLPVEQRHPARLQDALARVRNHG